MCLVFIVGYTFGFFLTGMALIIPLFRDGKSTVLPMAALIALLAVLSCIAVAMDMNFEERDTIIAFFKERGLPPSEIHKFVVSDCILVFEPGIRTLQPW